MKRGAWLCIAAGLLVVFFSRTRPDVLPTAATSVPEETHPPAPISCASADASLFAKNMATTAVYPHESIAAATVPHYAPAQDMLVKELNTVRQGGEEPQTVVIVAPNHTGLGAAVQLWGGGFTCGGNALSGDGELLSRLSSALDGKADTSGAQTAQDHSVTSIIPYVSEYWPHARVVTILLSRGASSRQLSVLAQCLHAYTKEQAVLLLASVDFSHYQTPEIAQKNDRETINAIESGAAETVLSYGGEHVDSPQTMTVLMKFCTLQDKALRLRDHRLEVYTENGQKKAGSFMVFF